MNAAPTATTVRTPTQVATLGTVVGVWAHPDDEAYLSAGLMALARDAGQRVVCVTATRGEHGTGDPQRWPPHALAAERTGELARSLAELGVREHHWLGHPDGGCADAPPEPVVVRLAALFARVAPDTVLTFGPDGLTGHPDHRTVSAWTAAAFHRGAPAGARLLYAVQERDWADRWRAVNDRLGIYLGDPPEPVPADRLAVDLQLTGRTLRRKLHALRAQTTQTAALIGHLGEPVYADWVAREFFMDAAGSAVDRSR
jgi:LmbE family N-acetylglucosaminyl deacetylase